MPLPKRLTPVMAYSFAVVCVGLSFGVRLALRPWLGSIDPFAFFLWAVVGAAFAGGFWAGLLSTMLSCAAALFFFSQGGLRFDHFPDLVAPSLFVIRGSFASFLCAALRHAVETSTLSARHSQTSAADAAMVREREMGILDSIADGFIAFDSKWRITFVNERAAQFLGHRRAELLGMHTVSLYPNVVLSEAYPKLHRAMESGQTVDFEFQDESGDLWFGASANPSREGVSLLIRDITASRKMEVAVKESEERFRIMADSAPLKIWTSTREGNRDYVNARFLRFSGRSIDAELGWGWLDLVHPDDRSRVRETYEIANEGQFSFTCEYRMLRFDGEYRWILDNGAPRSSPRGDFLGSVGSSLDVTDRHTTEASLRETVEQLQLSMSISQTGTYTHEVETDVVTLSPELERIFGLQSGTYPKNTGFMLSCIHRDDREKVVEATRSVYLRGGECEFEYRLLRGDGQARWLLVRARGYLDGAGKCTRLVGVGIDITERKLFLERVQHAQKLESLGVLAGGIAHDFNNLLTGILGGASMVLEDLEPSSLAWKLQRNVIEASQRAAQLTGQMLAYSGKGHFSVETIDVAKLVRDNLRLMQASFLNKKVDLVLAVDDLHCRVEADPAQMQQIVMNLVINAAESIPEDRMGTVSVSVRRLRITLDSDGLPAGEYVSFKVEDTGTGMDQPTIARIFDPFFTTKFAGRGLGLAAVQGIVRGHKGIVRVSSIPGQGSTFDVILPRVATSPVMRHVEAAPRWRGSGTVLVVEDEEMVRATASAALERLGFTVIGAEHGQRAVDLFRAAPEQFVAVLLDMNMPVMNGEEALTQIKLIRRDVKVIICSGYSETEAVHRFAAHGLDAFIQKPYSSSQLAEKVRAVTTCG